MHAPPPPSLDLLATRVADEREALRRHAESLDAKAGVLVGASAALVALLGPADRLGTRAAVALAVAATLVALVAFLPAHPRWSDLRGLDASADPVLFRTTLLDRDTRAHRREVERTRTGERLVRLATTLLAVAASVAGIDVLGIGR